MLWCWRVFCFMAGGSENTSHGLKVGGMSVQRLFKQGAERARFEADRLQRTLKVQSEIGNLRTQVRRAVIKLGETALHLYRQDALIEEELNAVAQSIEALEAQIAEAETKLAQIKAETPPEREEAVVEQSKAGERICSNCRQIVPAEVRFCIHCGSPLTSSSSEG